MKNIFKIIVLISDRIIILIFESLFLESIITFRVRLAKFHLFISKSHQKTSFSSKFALQGVQE